MVDRQAASQERFERIMGWLGPTPPKPVEENSQRILRLASRRSAETADISENLSRELGLKP